MNLKPRLLSPPALLSCLLGTAAVARAHPGHDGHELTWDLQHLQEHPLATATWVVVLGAAVWAAWRLLRAHLRGH